VRIALVTTPAEARSGIGDYTRHLLPYLRENAEVELFVDVGLEGEEASGERTRGVDQIVPREFDQILYQLGNETQHAFMVPMISGLGGTVMLHDWVLFDLALAAFPRIARGGLRGLRRAFAEGGLAEAAVYLKNKRAGVEESAAGEGIFRSGWFAPELPGQWSGRAASIFPPRTDRLRLRVMVPAGRELRVLAGDFCVAELDARRRVVEEELLIDLDPDDDVALRIEVTGIHPTPEQRLNGDLRELGIFLRGAACWRGGVWETLELGDGGVVEAQGLSRDRFRLTFNHSVVRRADAFLVHSDWMGEQILASRNAFTPIARVHHGAERRWRDEDRREARAGLADEWRDHFIVASFGALQAHKRPGVLLQAVARAQREREGLRLLLIGEERPNEFDLRTWISRLQLEEVVKVSGWLPQEEVWQGLHAADLCVNLRGPSAGGTSGGASQALALGRGVIVSDLPELAHLPGDCVLRVAAGEGEVEELSRLLVELYDDAPRREKIELAARRAVDEELHWSHAAKRYVEALEGFPHARAARRSLLVRFVHATKRNR